MQMNSNIILSGAQPNILAAVQSGNEAGQQKRQFDQQNALAAMMKEQGPGILAGNQQSLNALAQFDPEAALGVQSTRLGMDQTRLGMEQTRQNMQFSAEDQAMARTQAKQQAEAHLAQMSATEAEQERQKVEHALAMATQAQSPEQWDQIMQQTGQADLVGQFGAKDIIIAGGLGLKDALEAFKPDAPPKPNSAEAKLKADLTAGLINENEYQLGLQRLAPKGTEIISDGKGGVTVREGVGVGGGKTPTADFGGAAMNVDAVIKEIDAIMTDKSLPKVIGPVEGGGGNNIDDMNMAQRLYYGGKGLSLIEKIGQLQNKTWFGARDMLKGGGAITDYESKKAEGAMGRLSRAKSEEEFNAALMDLKDAIVEGKRKLESAGGQAPVEAPSAGAGSGSPSFDPAQLSPEAAAVLKKYSTPATP